MHDSHCPFPHSASPIHSIGTVIEMMLTSRIHRVWIVDGEDKPIGVVTMSDILSALVPPSPIHETAV